MVGQKALALSLLIIFLMVFYSASFADFVSARFFHDLRAVFISGPIIVVSLGCYVFRRKFVWFALLGSELYPNLGWFGTRFIFHPKTQKTFTFLTLQVFVFCSVNNALPYYYTLALGEHAVEKLHVREISSTDRGMNKYSRVMRLLGCNWIVTFSDRLYGASSVCSDLTGKFDEGENVLVLGQASPLGIIVQQVTHDEVLLRGKRADVYRCAQLDSQIMYLAEKGTSSALERRRRLIVKSGCERFYPR